MKTNLFSRFHALSIRRKALAVLSALTLVVGITNLCAIYHVQASEIDRLTAALNAAADPTPTLSLCFYPEYGNVPAIMGESGSTASSIQLAKDTVYRLGVKIPRQYLNTRPSLDGSLVTEHNRITAELYYPQHVTAGEAAQIVVLIKVNDSPELFTGHIGFTALDNLSLINGDDLPSYTSSGSDISLNDGTLYIRFYTGATPEFNHPDSTGCSGYDNLHCSFYDY